MKKLLLFAALATFSSSLVAETRVVEDVFTGGVASMPTYFGDATIPNAKYNSNAPFEAISLVTGAKYLFPEGAFISAGSKAMIIPFGPSSVTITMPQGCTKINIFGEASTNKVTVTISCDGNTFEPMIFQAYKDTEDHILDIKDPGKEFVFTNTASSGTNWWIKKIQYTLEDSGQSQQGTLTGQVVDPDNNPVADAGVALAQNGIQVGYATTDDSGGYVIKVDNCEGTYELTATRDGYFPSESQSLSFDHGKATAKEAVLVPTVARGVVTYEGTPLENVAVTMLLDQSTIATRMTDGEGKFLFDHVLDYNKDYVASVNADGYELQTLEVKFDAQTKAPVTLNISLEKKENFVMLSGNILAPRDLRLAGANVTLIHGPEVFTTVSDEDGFYFFQLTNPEGDDFVVQAVSKGYFPTLTEPFGFNGKNVEGKDLILTPTIFQGYVTGSGNPVCEASVIVSIDGQTVAQATTDIQGEFIFDHLLDYDKTYQVTIAAEGFEPFQGYVAFDPVTQDPVTGAYELSLESAIESTGASMHPSIYFDLLGRQVAKPSHGIYILATGSKIQKVVL